MTDLNEEQALVRDIGPGRVAVTGNPGSGKTTALIARVIRLLDDGLPGKWILAVTFTRMAAKQLKDRLGGRGRNVTACTIHSLAYQLAKSSLQDSKLDKFGGQEGRAIEDSLQEISKTTKDASKITVDQATSFISKCKGTGPVPVYGNVYGLNWLGTENVKSIALRTKGIASAGPGVAVRLYNAVEAKRAARGFHNYDDMIVMCWMRLVSDGGYLAWMRSRWSAIIMDEAQDSNALQWDILRLLHGLPSLMTDLPKELPGTSGVDTTGRSFLIAGDPSQSLYSWRAAVPELFLNFATSPATKHIILNRSYRSNKEISGVASSFVKKEPWHLGGEIKAMRGEAGEARLWVTMYPTIADEARAIVDRCIEYAAGGGKLRHCAVLSRLSGFLHLAELRCLEKEIPYEKRASGTFMTSKPVVDLLAYMKSALGIATFEEQKKMVCAPFRMISRKAYEDAKRQMKMRANCSLIDALLIDKDLYRKQKHAVLKIKWLLEHARSMIEEDLGAEPILQQIIKESGYVNYITRQRGSNASDSSALAIIGELQALASEHSTLKSFVDELDSYQSLQATRQHTLRVKNYSPGDDFLILSTVHQMKGLEAPHIFLCDVSKGRLPWDAGHSPDEEKRIFYVAITRARESVNISYNASDGASPYIESVKPKKAATPKKVTSTEKDEVISNCDTKGE